MSGRFPPMVSRLAALALLLLVAGIVGAGVIEPVAGHVSELRAEIGRQRELLARFEAYAANEPAAEAEAARSETAKASGIFLSGETDALRTASLQGQIRAIAEAQRVRLVSARSAPALEREGLRLTSVQAEFDADLRQLQAILLAVEASRPHLFLQSVQVAPAGGYRSQEETLRVRLGIAAAAAVSVAEAKP
jgi:hypothetical protein